MALRLTREELELALTRMFELLGEGMSDEEVRHELGLERSEYKELREKMLRHRADVLARQPREHAYVEYLLAQSANLSDLTRMIENFKASRQYNAMVGAVRTKADILDRLIAKGQEFGLLRKEPETKRIVAGVMVAQLSNTELRRLVTRELGQLNAMVQRFGNGDGDNFTNMEVGDPYEIVDMVAPADRQVARSEASRPGPRPVTKRKERSRTNRSKTNHTYRGRRVVKHKKLIPRPRMETGLDDV